MPKKNWGKSSFIGSTFGIVPRGLIPDPSEDSDHTPASPKVRGNRPLSSDSYPVVSQQGGHLAQFDDKRVFKANTINKKFQQVQSKYLETGSYVHGLRKDAQKLRRKIQEEKIASELERMPHVKL